MHRYLPVLDQIYYQTLSTSPWSSRFLRIAGSLKALSDPRLSASDLQSLLCGCEGESQTYRLLFANFSKKEFKIQYYQDGLWESVPNALQRFVENYDNEFHPWKLIPDSLHQFLEDRSRSGNFFLDGRKYHADIARLSEPYCYMFPGWSTLLPACRPPNLCIAWLFFPRFSCRTSRSSGFPSKF